MTTLRQLKINPAWLRAMKQAEARVEQFRKLDVAVRANTGKFETAMARLAPIEFPDPPEFSVEPIRAFLRELADRAGNSVGERLARELHPQEPARSDERPRRDTAPDLLTNEEKAIALAVKHPEWTDTRIAKHLGVSRTSVYRWERFKDARRKLRKIARNEAQAAQRRKTVPE
jgi:hypothetical protein